MKKKSLVILVGMTIVIGLLSACGKNSTDTVKSTTEVVQDVTENANIEDEELVGKGVPIEEVSPEKIVEVTGSTAILPDNAENPMYLLVNNELGEIRFTLDNAKYNMTLRSQKLDEFTDISGMYYAWQSEYDETMGNYDCKVMNYNSAEEGARIYLWFDAENKIMYSLSAKAKDLSELDLYGVVASMMQVEPSYDEEIGGYPSNAMEERTGKTEFESYDEVISYLEGTEAYAFVKIKGYNGDVLLVSDNVYDNLDGNMASIQAVPYTMKSSGIVSADSLLTSGGTAYPISIDKDGLVYLCGNHSIETECYGENGTEDVGIMVMNTIAITEFDSEWNPLKVSGFYRNPEITNIMENESAYYDENDVTAFDTEYEKFVNNASPVNFTAVDGRTPQ